MTKEQIISTISKYIKQKSGYNFNYSLSAVVDHEGERYSIFSSAFCDQREFGEDYGKLFFRLSSLTNRYKEIEVFAHELDESQLQRIYESNGELQCI